MIRFAIPLLLLCAACQAIVTNHGLLPDPEALAAVKPRTSDKAEVQARLGTPSTTGTFDDDVWYYMSEKREKTAFFKPRVVERKVIAIVFDPQSRVDNIFTYTEADGRPVDFVSRVTPTAGNELTLIQQLFGNMGRFNR